MKHISPRGFVCELRANDYYESLADRAAELFDLKFALVVPRTWKVGDVTIIDIASILEDELGIRGKWSNFFSVNLYLFFEHSTDMMLAKLRFAESYDLRPTRPDMGK